MPMQTRFRDGIEIRVRQFGVPVVVVPAKAVAERSLPYLPDRCDQAPPRAGENRSLWEGAIATTLRLRGPPMFKPFCIVTLAVVSP